MGIFKIISFLIVTRVETVGKMKIKFHVAEKNMKKFGYA